MYIDDCSSTSKSKKTKVQVIVEDTNKDNVNIGYFNLLHGVLIPAARKIPGRPKKFTIDDSVSAFILEVKQAADMDSLLNQRREECIQKKVRLQPLIIVVGEKFHYKDFYVSIDNVKYKM